MGTPACRWWDTGCGSDQHTVAQVEYTGTQIEYDTVGLAPATWLPVGERDDVGEHKALQCAV